MVKFIERNYTAGCLGDRRMGHYYLIDREFQLGKIKSSGDDWWLWLLNSAKELINVTEQYT